jgi:hypothetical protein
MCRTVWIGVLSWICCCRSGLARVVTELPAKCKIIYRVGLRGQNTHFRCFSTPQFCSLILDRILPISFDQVDVPAPLPAGWPSFCVPCIDAAGQPTASVRLWLCFLF